MIFVNGCSFTAPSDDNNSWVEGFYYNGFEETKRISSKHLTDKKCVLNVAVGGSSNSIIRRKTFWYLNNAPFNVLPDYAIIQWSTIDRWDYPIFVNKERSKNFPRVKNRQDWVDKINYMCNGTDTFGYGKEFYENYYSFYGAVLETLENIYHTQQYLKEKNVPYKMITIGNLFGMDVSVEKLKMLQTIPNFQKGNYANLKTYNKTMFEKLEEYENSWYELDIIKPLLQKIDFTKFIFTDDENISGFGGGIIEWFLNKNEPLTGGDWHPSEEQHLRFFNEFLWDKIKNEINAVIK